MLTEYLSLKAETVLPSISSKCISYISKKPVLTTAMNSVEDTFRNVHKTKRQRQNRDMVTLKKQRKQNATKYNELQGYRPELCVDIRSSWLDCYSFSGPD